MFFVQADATKLPFATDSIDLVFGSPPYCDARSYGISAQRNAHEWVDWMIKVSEEACRVSKGLVLWVCAGVTRKWNYWPACEGLMWEWFKRGNRQWRCAYWHRVGIPGSGGKQWLRADIEYVLAFTKCRGAIPWADNVANGHKPKWAPGGDMSHRLSDGARVNQWGHSLDSGATVVDAGGVVRSKGKRPSHKDAMGFHQHGGRGRDKDGVKKITRRISSGHGPDGDTRQDDEYVPPALANPGCLVKGIKVGGGLMGHKLAHLNEAPFPVKLAQWFIASWCPVGGMVLDPFSGSGTTCHAATSLGRIGIGCDIRLSQCELGRRRCQDVQPEMFA